MKALCLKKQMLDRQIIIRTSQQEDATVLCKWWNDGSIMAHAGFPKGLSLTVHEVEALIAKNDESTQILMILMDDMPVGEMSYRLLNSHCAEIGIKLCESTYQNKGYGTLCIEMLLMYIFETIKANSVVLDTHINNTRAQKVYEKIGFQKVETRLQSWQDQLGQWQTSVHYQMTQDHYHMMKRYFSTDL